MGLNGQVLTMPATNLISGTNGADTLNGAALNDDLDTLFLQQSADIGRRNGYALLARADFFGNTDNHLRYPRLWFANNRQIRIEKVATQSPESRVK